MYYTYKIVFYSAVWFDILAIGTSLNSLNSLFLPLRMMMAAAINTITTTTATTTAITIPTTAPGDNLLGATAVTDGAEEVLQLLVEL